MGPKPLGKTQLSHSDFADGIGIARGHGARRSSAHRQHANPTSKSRHISVMDKGGTDYLAAKYASRERGGKISRGRNSK